MSETFLHGVQVVEIDAGPRPVRTVRSSVIGIVGTAPDADPVAFPLNTPVLIAGSRTEAAKLDTTGDGLGTLPAALDGIFDQAGAVVIVVRVEEAINEQQTIANVIGGVNSINGNLEGVQALLGAESVVGFAPRILIAPGFTHQKMSGGGGSINSITVTNGGSGYTDGTYFSPVFDFNGGSGDGGLIQFTVSGGVVTQANVNNSGSGYTQPMFISLPSEAGTPTVQAEFSVELLPIVPTSNPVTAELIGIADRLRAVVIQDGPNTTDAAAIAAAGDFGSARILLVDPWVKVINADGEIVDEPASARVAGLIAKSDNDRGFWWSPSNQTINGIVGTSRPVDFKLGDANSRANLLNEAKVTTIIRQEGFRLWGNRSLSADPKFAFLSVRRTADIINESLQRAHLWAVDRNITRTYVEDVVESVNGYLRSLVGLGAILGGQCWPDPDLNTPANITQGKVYFNFDFTPPYPAESITFRSQLVNDYISEVFE